MAKVLISYARTDGITAAARLRVELEKGGHTSWQDVEDMRSGTDWKNQIREAIRAVDAVLVLLTPAAEASKPVTWEWETALTLGTRVIVLLISPCNVPDDLKNLHYHDLSAPEKYIAGLMALSRDLNELPRKDITMTEKSEKPQSAPKYAVYNPYQSGIGDWTTVYNNPDSSQRTQQLLERLSEIERTISGGLGSIRQGVLILHSKLDDNHRAELAHISQLVRTNEIDNQEMQILLEGIYQAVKAVETGQIKVAGDLKRAIDNIIPIFQSTLDARHRLEVVLPLIPPFLNYKYEFSAGGEIDTNPILESLRERWQKLRNRKSVP